MKQLHNAPKKRILTSALLLALASPAWAQDAAEKEAAAPTTSELEATDLDAVVVTGIRGSLTSSMNLKRDAQGIVERRDDSCAEREPRVVHVRHVGPEVAHHLEQLTHRRPVVEAEHQVAHRRQRARRVLDQVLVHLVTLCAQQRRLGPLRGQRAE